MCIRDRSEILEYLGLGDLEKEILFSAAPRAAIQTGLEKLRGELPFSRPVSYTHLRRGGSGDYRGCADG